MKCPMISEGWISRKPHGTELLPVTSDFSDSIDGVEQQRVEKSSTGRPYRNFNSPDPFEDEEVCPNVT